MQRIFTLYKPSYSDAGIVLKETDSDLRERLLYFSSQLLKLPVFISPVPYPLFLAPHPNTTV